MKITRSASYFWRILLLSSCYCLLTTCTTLAATRYVSSYTGIDTGTATDPGSPCATIQYAVDQAVDGDDIWVATFDVALLTSNRCVYTGSGENVFELTDAISLKVEGGYLYDHTVSPLWIKTPVPPMVDAEGTRRGLYIAGSDGATNVVELIEFANGSASTGANVYAEGGNAVFVGTPIHNGSAINKGGGMYLSDIDISMSIGSYSNLALPQMTGMLPVYSNNAIMGGGIYVESGIPVLSTLGLQDNEATGHGGAVYIQGGSPSLVGGIIINNHADDSGGAFFLENSFTRIGGMTIVSNSAMQGGAFYVNGPFALSPVGATIIANNYICYNQGTAGAGGAFFLREANIGLLNNVIANNIGTTGAAACLYASSPQFFQNTIADNIGDTALYVTHAPGEVTQQIIQPIINPWTGGVITPGMTNMIAGIPIPCWPAFTNNIIAGHDTALYVASSGNSFFENKVSMGYTLWTNDVDIAGAGMVIQHHDVYADPLFTCTELPPGCTDPYHIETNSPAVDAGIVISLTLPGTDFILDIDGQLRPSGDGMDIGADEVVPLSSYSAWFVPAGYDLVVQPGDIVTNEHYLLNSGDLGDTYDMTMSNSLAWTSTAAHTQVALTGQSYTTVTVIITVPGAAADADENITTVMATSTTDTDRIAYAADICTAQTNANAPTVRYVWLDSPNPLAPYESWETAGRVIQTVIDVCNASDTVKVADGIHDTGSMLYPGDALTNRVCMTNAITLRSENGPSNCFIMGAANTGGGSGPAAIRCAFMLTNTTLSGFTLLNGHTLSNSTASRELDGGAVWAKGGIITNCIISSCQSRYGGAIYLRTGGAVKDCQIEQNGADVGGGIYCRVAGIVQGCTIVSNQGYLTGAFFAGAGGVMCDGGGEVRYCDITWNTTGSGGQSSAGGVFCYQGGLVDHCRILNNSAMFAGGGVYLASGGDIFNSLLVGNSATYGGGVSFYSGSAGAAQNCTIVSNTAATGGGINNNYGGTSVNCIVYYNHASDGTHNFRGTNATFSYCCTTPDFPMVGLVSMEPGFIDAGSDYRLMSNSPCLDMGESQPWMAAGTDLDGYARIHNMYVDYGAYEFQGTAQGADADNDGLENAEERDTYLTDPTNPDTDSDGSNDGDEIFADTDATSSNSVFQLTDIDDSASCVVTFSCTNSRQYSLQFATNMVDSEWFMVDGAANITGSGSSMSLTDTVSSVQRSYRVGVALP